MIESETGVSNRDRPSAAAWGMALGALLLCGSLLALPRLASAQAAQSGRSARGPDSCAPAGDLHFVCNLVDVEDFVPVGGGRWLVGGSLSAGSVGLYLIDTAAKTAKAVALSLAAKPEALYAGCPAPDLKGLSTHGVDVRQSAGRITVYAINHGGRESVEIFRLHPASATAEWIGCTLMPADANGNAIAVLPRGAFVVTKFMDDSDKQGLQHILAGEVTGAVYLWTRGKGFSEVPGTQLSGDNGILASKDGRWLYINAYGSREVYRVPLSGQGKRVRAKVDFYPDNLRWAPDGSIFVTGQFLHPPSLAGLHGWATVRLDPEAMTTTPLVREAGRPQFDNATSAVQIGQWLWFGTFRGDRVAYRSMP